MMSDHKRGPQDDEQRNTPGGTEGGSDPVEKGRHEGDYEGGSYSERDEEESGDDEA